MKLIRKNNIIKVFVILLVSFMATEIAFRGVMGYKFFDYATLRILFGNIVLSAFFSVIISFLNRLFERIITILLTFLVSFYAMLQIGFYNYLGVYISLGTSGQATKVKDYLGDFVNSFRPTYLLVYLPLIIVIGYYVFEIINIKKDKTEIKNKVNKSRSKKIKAMTDKEKRHEVMLRLKNLTYDKKRFLIERIILGALILIFSGLYAGSLFIKGMQNELQLESNKDLFVNPTNPNISVNQFGTTMFFVLDLKTTIIPASTDNTDELNIDYGSSGSGSLPVVSADYQRTFDDTNWHKLNDETKNQNYVTLNNYFLNREITPKNEYTGMFKGKNVIFVMMESANTLLIDEEKFPTLYKMYTEGYAWENAYSPRNACSTGNNEMSGLISLYTIYRSCTYNNYRQNTYFESIFNLFNNAGYHTTSYHNYTDQYYYRNIIHPKMGSSKFYDVKALKMKYSGLYKEWPSDVLLMDKASEIFLNHNDGKPFMAWITTVTSHQPYNQSSEFGDKYLSLYKDTKLPMSVRRYLSKLTELDKSLEKLLKNLDEAGVLNDTVIVLYADHYPYGIPTSELKKAFDYNISENYEIDRTPFIIYNAGTKGEIKTELTSYINILPTVANLFDLDYDPRLYMGYDLFSESYPNILVFADGSWQSEIGFYDATKGKIKYYGSSTYTLEEIKEINSMVKTKLRMSSLAITSNYFNYLEKGLKRIEKESTEDKTN